MGLLCTTLLLAATAKKTVKKPSAKPAAKPQAKPATPAKPDVKPDAKPVEFLFIPPDGTTYIEAYKGTSIVSTDGLKLIPEVTEWKTKVTITRTTDGYHVVRTPLSYTTADIDEETPKAIFTRCLRTAKLEYDLELTGYCSKVEGLDKVVKEMKEKTEKLRGDNDISDSSDTDKEDASLLKNIASFEKSSWNSRYTQLMGLYVKPGECMKESAELPIFYGLSSPGTIEIQVLGLQKVGNRDCAKVQYTMYTNSNKPDKYTGQMLKMLFLSYTAIKSSYYGISRFSASAKQECIIDPATMLVYSESSKSNSIVEMAFENDMKTSISFDEYEQYTYEYEK